MDALSLAQKGMETVFCQMRLSESPSVTLSYSTKHAYKTGDQVLVYREQKKEVNRAVHHQVWWRQASFHGWKWHDSSTFIATTSSIWNREFWTCQELHEKLTFVFNSKKGRGIQFQKFLNRSAPNEWHRCNSPDLEKAKLNEIEGLVNRETWRVA